MVKIFFFFERFFSIALSSQYPTKNGASFSKEDYGQGLPLYYSTEILKLDSSL